MSIAKRFSEISLLLIITILPFFFEPLRVEGHEPHRASLLFFLVLLTIPYSFRQLKSATKSQKLLLFAMSALIFSLLISTVFSLSPYRSFMGDLIRKAGFWTQLAIIGLVFVGKEGSLGKIWRWVWFAGLLVGTHILFNQSDVGLQNRVIGIFGWTTFTTGWLALALVWSSLGMMSSLIRKELKSFEIFSFSIGIAVIAMSLLALGSRGSAIAAISGIGLGILLWIAKRGKRHWLIYGFAGFILIITSFFGLKTLNWGSLPFPETNLFTRLRFQDDFREGAWHNSLLLVSQWSELSDNEGNPDSWASIRFLVGYGLENFEPPEHKISSEGVDIPGDTRVDRAHNDWLDTLIMTGWLGLISRVSFWCIGIYLALKRLELWHPLLGILSFVGASIAAILVSGTPFIPLIVTLTVFGILCLWIIASTFRHTKSESTDIDWEALICLSLICTHLLENQFGFTTVATSVLAWISLGLLLQNESELNSDGSYESTNGLILGLSGALLIYGLNPVEYGIFPMISLLLVGVAGQFVLESINIKSCLTILIFWSIGYGLSFLTIPEFRAFATPILIFSGLAWLFIQKGALNTRPRPMVYLPATLIILSVMIIWWRDISADMLLLKARQNSDLSAAVIQIEDAIAYRPFDSILYFEASNFSLRNAQREGDIDALYTSQTYIERAIAIHPFDALYAYTNANIEANLVFFEPSGNHVQAADRAFQNAIDMWSNNHVFWREWGRFALVILDDVDLAAERINYAQNLNPRDVQAAALWTQIEMRQSR